MFLFFAILTAAVVSDAYSGRVPRELTGIGFLLSQAWLICQGSIADALMAYVSGVGLLLILYPIFMIGAMGAGDLKLIMIFPSYMGFISSIKAVMWALTAGAVIGLVRLIKAGILKERLLYLIAYIREVSRMGRLMKYDVPAADTGAYMRDYQIHFTVPVMIGAVMTLGGIGH